MMMEANWIWKLKHKQYHTGLCSMYLLVVLSYGFSL
ncbi:unnamed protein product [Arabidopsis halleri]